MVAHKYQLYINKFVRRSLDNLFLFLSRSLFLFFFLNILRNTYQVNIIDRLSSGLFFLFNT